MPPGWCDSLFSAQSTQIFWTFQKCTPGVSTSHVLQRPVPDWCPCPTDADVSLEDASPQPLSQEPLQRRASFGGLASPSLSLLVSPSSGGHTPGKSPAIDKTSVLMVCRRPDLFSAFSAGAFGGALFGTLLQWIACCEVVR